MSAVIWVTQKSRLSQLIDEAGGMTVGTALKAADSLTQPLREVAIAAIADDVAALDAAVAVAPEPGEESAWLERVYGLSYGLLELAGPFGLEDMCGAAYSLCALTDGQRRLNRLHLEPIRLHAAAIRLLTQGDESPETRKAVLEGLSRISDRAARAES